MHEVRLIIFILAGFFLLSLVLWLMEIRRNRGKAKNEEKHIARLFMQLNLVIILVFTAFAVRFSMLGGNGQEKTPAEQNKIVRPLSTQEISEFAQKGIKNIPQGTLTKIDKENGYNYSIYIPNDRSGSFSWGPFQLNHLMLIPRNMLIDVYGMTNHKTMQLNGQECLTDYVIAFVQKKEIAQSSLHFDDYRLSSCIVDGIVVNTPQGKLNLGQIDYANTDTQNGILPAVTNTKANYAYANPSEALRKILYLPNDVTLDNALNTVIFYTDENYRLVAALFRLYHNRLDKVKIGQCEYPNVFTEIVLTDFTKDTAHWHFYSNNHQAPIAHGCEMQVLPYRLKITK